jgi:hypothetical protein
MQLKRAGEPGRDQLRWSFLGIVEDERVISSEL